MKRRCYNFYHLVWPIGAVAASWPTMSPPHAKRSPAAQVLSRPVISTDGAGFIAQNDAPL